MHVRNAKGLEEFKEVATTVLVLTAGQTCRVAKGWFNAGYIFPDGFHSRTLFRSSVQLDSLVAHDCFVAGEGGDFWPAPTFILVAADRASEPLKGKSCTACWSQVLKRINAEIERRRAGGESLPPAPKTAIAGPEYFGFNMPEIVEQIEALDVNQECTLYWAGKQDRLDAKTSGVPTSAASAARLASAQEKSSRWNSRGRRSSQEPEEPEEVYTGASAWSAVSRAERYKQRCAGDGAAAAAEDDNPMPGYLDPVTLAPVVRPAMAPSGHVMGMATWRAVLADRGCCPFTKQRVQPHQLVALTANNIDHYRSRIVGWDAR